MQREEPTEPASIPTAGEASEPASQEVGATRSRETAEREMSETEATHPRREQDESDPEERRDAPAPENELGLEDAKPRVVVPGEEDPTVAVVEGTVEVSIEELANSVEDYENRSILTRGRVGTVLDERAFTFDVDAGLGGTTIYVLVPGNEPHGLRQGEMVEVEGAVRRLTMEELRAVYGADLSDHVTFSGWLDRNVIIASEIGR